MAKEDRDASSSPTDSEKNKICKKARQLSDAYDANQFEIYPDRLEAFYAGCLTLSGQLGDHSPYSNVLTRFDPDKYPLFSQSEARLRETCGATVKEIQTEYCPDQSELVSKSRSASAKAQKNAPRKRGGGKNKAAKRKVAKKTDSAKRRKRG